MYAWESIQKTIDYVEEHLGEEIQIEELANLAGLSPFYFQRLFARLVKKPVCEYIKLRRLTKSAECLKSSGDRIVDVAMEYGFSSHSNFTRSFKEVYGITPEECRDTKVPLNQFVKPDLMLNYVMVDENVPLIADGIILEVTRKSLKESRFFTGIAKEIPIVEFFSGTDTGISTAAKLWNEFHKKKPNIPNLLKDGNEFGVLYIGDAPQGYCTYLAGAEITKDIHAETGESANSDIFTTFELPADNYLICGYEAENFDELTNCAIFKAQTFMGKWMESHQVKTSMAFAAEMYYPVTSERAYMENWMLIV